MTQPLTGQDDGVNLFILEGQHEAVAGIHIYWCSTARQGPRAYPWQDECRNSDRKAQEGPLDHASVTLFSDGSVNSYWRGGLASLANMTGWAPNATPCYVLLPEGCMGSQPGFESGPRPFGLREPQNIMPIYLAGSLPNCAWALI